MPQRTFKAVIRKERFFMAECPELGLEAHGNTFVEALDNLRIETEEYLKSLGADALAMLDRLSARPGGDMRRDGVMVRRYRAELPEAGDD